LQVRLLFLQLLQCGIASSHLRCLSRQVRHPVRTRFGLLEPSPSFSPSPFATSPFVVSDLGPTLFTFFEDFVPVGFGASFRFWVDALRLFGGVLFTEGFAEEGEGRGGAWWN
jgi:hypothetical protein